MHIAKRANIEVFATGGIGGVHRGVDQSFDISQDLAALSKLSMVVVSAGAKSVLDLPKTVELLVALRFLANLEQTLLLQKPQPSTTLTAQPNLVRCQMIDLHPCEPRRFHLLRKLLYWLFWQYALWMIPLLPRSNQN